MSTFEPIGEESGKSRKPMVLGIVVVACLALGVLAVWNEQDVQYHMETANNIIRRWSCPPGGYPSGPGQRGKNCLCTKCPAGHKCAGGHQPKRQCRPGRFQNLLGQSTCKPCARGAYCPRSGASGPTPCQHGHYNNRLGQSACTAASPGNHVPGRGATGQTQCNPGKIQPRSGQRYCVNTPPGTYTNKKGQTRGTPCHYGSYQPSAGQTSCKKASPGNKVPGRGQRRQTPCGGNKVQHCNGQMNCIPCPPGLYAQVGHRSCGAHNPNLNGVKCVSAKAGFATIRAPRTGVLKGITLTHVRGKVFFCGSNPKCFGKFGLGSIGPNKMVMLITRNENKARPALVYPRAGTRGYRNLDSHMFYLLPGYNYNSNKITFHGPRTSVRAGEVYRVYVNEVYTKKTLSDNGGKSCFRTTYNYA